MLILFSVIFKCIKKINLIELKNLYLIFFITIVLIFDFSFHILLIQIIYVILLSINIEQNQRE